jgi:hypothetical protein
MGQRSARHLLTPDDELSEAGVLPVSQKGPDKSRCGPGCLTLSGHCILVVGSWLQKVVVLAVPCELCDCPRARHGRLTLNAW